MKDINSIYEDLMKSYGPQGWWPLISDKTLLCEYHPGDYSYPKTEEQRFEVCIGAILAQNTSWYPGVVRALQQLKLGRCFTKKELEVMRQAEVTHRSVLEKDQKRTKGRILTQNTDWPNVEKALIGLKKLKAIDAKKILNMEEEKLRKAIRPAGYYNQKAKKLRIIAEFYLSLKGRTPSREELLGVWGVGKETADSILLYGYKKSCFVVDAYTKRIFSRVGYFKDNLEYDKVKEFFEKNLPRDWKVYQEFHALIVEHSKSHCTKIPNCQKCFLESCQLKTNNFI